jgi:phospholipid transport system substrate-binding protein
MKSRQKFTLYVFITVAIVLSRSWPVSAGEPTEEIRTAINQGVEILNRSKLDANKNRADVINSLRKIVYPVFDFKEMAKRSLGPYWRQLDPQQQNKFVSVFTEFLETTYADKIDLYDGQKVSYTGEVVDNDYATVNTKVIGNKGDSYSANYKLHQVDGKWKIYDVVVENISVVNNYRSQFNHVIRSSSFEELLKRMREKSS